MPECYVSLGRLHKLHYIILTTSPENIADSDSRLHPRAQETLPCRQTTRSICQSRPWMRHSGGYCLLFASISLTVSVCPASTSAELPRREDRGLVLDLNLDRTATPHILEFPVMFADPYRGAVRPSNTRCHQLLPPPPERNGP